jgi:rod shape determining protein RodA
MRYQELNNSATNKMDLTVVVLYMILLLIGWINIYSVTSPVEQIGFQPSAIAYKQLFWIGGAGLMIIILSYTNVVFMNYLSYYVYGFALILNIAVLFLGKEVAGAKSWFGFGGIGIQPSEFAKVATAMALAKFLGGYGVRFKGFKNIVISILIISAPFIIVLAQNDTGTALVFLAFYLVLFREGMPGYILLIAIWMGVLSITAIYMNSFEVSMYWVYGGILAIGLVFSYVFRKDTSIILGIGFIAILSMFFSGVIGWTYDKLFKEYQKDRIEIVLGLKEDPRGMGYNLEQSKIAIGAGKWFGRGFMNGSQTKMGFVPEQHTDFIFCTVGEEWGFLGVFIFFTVYLYFILRLLFLAERQSDTYGRILGYSASCIFFFHWLVNIGMTIGLVPVIGIPLPFMSFGGSSLWGFTLLLFVFLRHDQVRRN